MDGTDECGSRADYLSGDATPLVMASGLITRARGAIRPPHQHRCHAGGARDLASTLTQRLQLWTNERWMVSVVASGGAPTLKEQRETKERERRTGLEADPVVASVLAHFPGAQIIAVRRNGTGPRIPLK